LSNETLDASQLDVSENGGGLLARLRLHSLSRQTKNQFMSKKHHKKQKKNLWTGEAEVGDGNNSKARLCMFGERAHNRFKRNEYIVQSVVL
jgi:hypothetical protein